MLAERVGLVRQYAHNWTGCWHKSALRRRTSEAERHVSSARIPSRGQSFLGLPESSPRRAEQLGLQDRSSPTFYWRSKSCSALRAGFCRTRMPRMFSQTVSPTPMSSMAHASLAVFTRVLKTVDGAGASIATFLDQTCSALRNLLALPVGSFHMALGAGRHFWFGRKTGRWLAF